MKASLRHLPFICRMLCIAFLIVAVARPQTKLEEQHTEGEGIDIVLCIDVSGSMTAQDLTPNRLEAAKAVAIDFVNRRLTDRIGVVIFSGESFTQCPLTTDHSVLISAIQNIRNGLLEDGTAIGSGLGTSVDRLRSSQSKSKVVVLLTDGENNGGLIDPKTAKEIAKSFGVKVYTIGVGSESTAPQPIQTPLGVQMQTVKVSIDEKLLTEIANETGGQYFRATNNAGLSGIYSTIDALEKSKVEITNTTKFTEKFLPVCDSRRLLPPARNIIAVPCFPEVSLTFIYLATVRATVYRSTGSWYIVKNDAGEFLNARIKGKLKIDGITSTNPIAVGDIVEIDFEAEEGNLVISKIYDRRNYINRISPHNKNQHHIIAANLDQSLLFATLKDPKTSFGFIDRFLVTSEAYHIPAIIVFNKADLFKKREQEKFELAQNIYEPIGYKVMRMSIEEKTGVEEVKELLKDKTTLLSGHSGVGKSTFINYVLPEQLKTQDVSDWSGKGMHTTTFAEMYDLPFGGRIIDTPGIRELGLVDISAKELAQYFPEMRAVMNNCKFNNCVHFNEPGCAVKEAVNEGTISEGRYLSYLTIKDTIEEKGY